MPDPAVLDAVGGLSATALFVLALWAFYTRRVRTAHESEEDKAESDARLAEMRDDRDRWRAIAEAYGIKLDALTDVVEALVADGSKIDRILGILERVARDLARVLAKVVGP